MLTISQALFSGVFQSTMVIAALAVFAFTKSPALGSLASAVAIGGRVLVAYGAGRLMDSLGRKTVLYIGIAATCSALLIMCYALMWSSLELFWAGIFVFGSGAGVMNLLRVPVTDMYPARRRGEGMGYLLTGSVVGTFMAPLLSAAAPYMEFIGRGSYVIILLASLPLMVVAALFVWLVRPDTKEILRNIESYYPGEVVVGTQAGGACPSPAAKPSAGFRSTPIVAAFIASAFSWGGMVMGMSMVSILLKQYGVDLALINVAVSIHVFGMFGLSIPFGWLADRHGRKLVTALGGFILGAGAFLMPLTQSYLIITLGVFLIGLGWSATNVATTALLCDLTPGRMRGSILGANDVVTGVTSVGLPAIGGAILSAFGGVAFGVAGVAVALPVVLSMLLIKKG
jgi:MFS family permease